MIALKRTRSIVSMAVLALIAFIYLNNSSLWRTTSPDRPLLLAHRGLGQTFHMDGITDDTNTAERIHEPEHPYLENTIPSMEAAFAAGADIIELDIHPTTDGQFAVFHDWILEYRTDGHGVTREHTMAELKKLDVGYGYTADHGATYPFRGQGVGLMPALDEVLTQFPEGSFLIHIKSNDADEGRQLASYLKALPAERLVTLSVYGGDNPIRVLQEEIPELRVMSTSTMKDGLLPYMLVGWTGYIPQALRNTLLILPMRYARFLWGWPHRFVQRMKAVDTQVFVVTGDGRWAEGFDTVDDLEMIPPNYAGGIWTNRIDRIGPMYSQ